MSRKIFYDSGDKEKCAYFGWQDKEQCFYGLKKGYKNTADEIVKMALQKGLGGDIKTLDTYIFPVVFSYRHCIEISLKEIYMRCFGRIPKGGHDLLILWDKVKDEVIDQIILSEETIAQVKQYKKDFVKWNLHEINLNEIREMIKELQGFDNKADVWRYLMSQDTSLYFSECNFVDYTVIKENINYLYEILDYFHFIVNEYLSS